jgi:hypothetical protein
VVTLYVEHFPGTGANAWPTGWALTGTAANFDWTPGVGTIVCPQTSPQRGRRTVGHADILLPALRISFSALPSTGVVQLAVSLRSSTDHANNYGLLANVTAAGAIQSSIVRRISASLVTLAAAATITELGTYVADDVLVFEPFVRGSLVGMRLWRLGTAKPVQPTRSISDPSHASGAAVYLSGYTDGTNSPVVSVRAPLKITSPARVIDPRARIFRRPV